MTVHVIPLSHRTMVAVPRAAPWTLANNAKQEES